MKCQLTLDAVVILVVVTEVVSQLSAHHQLLKEGGDTLAAALPTVLNLQRHTLG